jgi:hypothetical protein
MATVYNHDVAGLCRRVNRFMEEMIKSVSSGTSEMNEFDQTRLSDYLGAILAYRDWVVAQPQLDLPETHPREHIVPDGPDVPPMENESVVDCLNLMVLCRDELMGSQSARDPSGLKSFDNARLEAGVTKAQRFLTDYIQAVTPLDLPESSPATAMTGPGRGGV